MFLTNDANKSPLSSLFGDSQNAWNGAELQIRRYWFLVEVEVTHRDEEDELKTINTLMLSRAEHVRSLVEQGLNVISVYLMIPLPSYEKGGWDMARLKEIWEAPELEYPSIKSKIYAAVDGCRFVESNFETTVDQFADWELFLKCPTGATTPAEQAAELG
ncbi:UNVERIFIED_ORG: hypothetical protein HNP28_003216 [Comamonas terrigena]